jgi:hypothetical protein
MALPREFWGMGPSMYSDGDLDAAVAAGVLTGQQAAGFRAFVAAREGTGAVDEEHFRLLTGFNDIFVSIAAILILLAVNWLGNLALPGFGGGFVAVASWALAEYFTRRRRMALPSIILLVSFVYGVFTLCTGAALHVVGSSDAPGYSGWLAASGAAASIATFAHWRRFRVPITVAIGAGAVLGTCLVSAAALVPALVGWLPPMALLGGLVVFALAMWWDARDRTRTTRRADVAFWLHLAAAPMIVHPTFQMLGLLGSGDTNLARAAAAIAIYVILAVVALAVDRRALLVSALFYVLYAMSALFRAAGSLSASFALTALVIGAALLLLSAFWHKARAAVVALMPPGLRARLPVV